MIGQSIGRYRIVAKLGEGGMGSVWRAEDTLLHRPVALKFLPDSLAASPEARQRFLREARAASQLDHPGIATVYDAGEADGRVYIAMLLVEGETVAQRLAREGRMPLAEAVRIARAAAEALAHAHAKGVLHRDISSGNLMMTGEGRVVVVDFGLALPEGATRLTQSQTVMGTAAYLAPEVVEGKPGDRRSDLYGLGVVLYEILTGALPFIGERRDALLYLIVHEPPPAPSALRSAIPEQLDRIVLRLLAKGPGERYSDATELTAALTAVGAPEALAKLDRREEEQALSPWLRLHARVDLAGRALRRAAVELATFRRGARLRATALVLVLAAGASAGVLWQLHLGPFAPATPSITSVAVLPLANKSQDPEASAHLAEGINEELVTKLGKLAGLRVIPWVTSQRYGDPALKLTEVARELHVDALIVGTFRKEGDRLSATLALVSGRDGFQRWADRFEQPVSDLFAVQREIALAVAAQIKGALSSSEEAALSTPAAHSVEAYEFYLKGAEAMHVGDRPSTNLALAYFDKALAVDPDLAEAHVGIGAINLDRYFRGLEGGSANLETAEARFDRALEIDPGNIAALRGLIHLEWERGHTEAMLRYGHQAVQNHPGSIEAIQAQGEAFLFGGLLDRAIETLSRVTELDPQNEAAAWFLIVAMAWNGQFEETVARGELFLRRFGEDPEILTWMAIAHQQLGQLEMARVRFERALALFGENGEVYIDLFAGKFYRRLGDEPRARTILENGLKQVESRLAAYPDNARIVVYRALFHWYLQKQALYEADRSWLLSESRNNHMGGLEALAILEFARGNRDTADILARATMASGDCGWPGNRYVQMEALDQHLDDPALREWLRKYSGCLDSLRARYP